MYRNKVQILLIVFLSLALLTACGKKPAGNEQSVQESTLSTQATGSTTQSTQDEETTVGTQQENVTVTVPFEEVSGSVGERGDGYETAPEQETEKGFFETVIDTIAGWLGGGSNSDKEQNAVNNQQTTDSTKPTENTQSSTQATPGIPPETDITEPEKDATEPSGDTSQETTGEDQDELTYEQWLAMSEDEQEAYTDSFATLKDFVNWFNAAKAEYDDKKDVEEMDGTIDLTH